MPSSLIIGQGGGTGSGGGGGNASVGVNGIIAPLSSTEIGFINAGGLEVGVSASNPLPVVIEGTIIALNPSVGPTGVAAPAFATEMGVINAGGLLEGVSASNPVRIDPTGTTVQPVSGTVTVNQGTVPWVVTGGFYQAVQPISGTVAISNFPATQPVSGTIAVTNAGTFPVQATDNITAWNSIALGSPSAYGTSPGAVNVIGVNAFVTNFPATQPVSGTVAVSNFPSSQAVTNLGTFAVQVSNFPATTVVVGNLTNNNAAPGATNVGVLPALANEIAPVWIEGNLVEESVDLSGYQREILGGVPTAVQKAAFSSTGSVTTLVCAFPKNVTKGDVLVIAVACGAASGFTIADTLGNVYLAVVNSIFTGNAFEMSLFWCRSKSSGADTITATNAGGAASMAAEIYELTGVDNVIPEAVTSQFVSTGTSVVTGSAANQTVPNGYMIAAVAVGTAAQTITLPVVNSNVFTEILTIDSGQINPTTPAGLFSFAAASGVSPQPQTIATNAPLGLLAGSEPWISLVVVFRPYQQAVSGTFFVAGQGTAPNVANMVPVSLTDGNAPPDGTAIATAILAPNNTERILAVGNWVATDASGSKWFAQRTPAIFKTASVPATASGNTAVWTPTAGKKFRLMRFQITAQGLSATAATILTISFQDATTGITIGTYDVLLPTVANLVAGITTVSAWVDLGNGYISTTINNVLNANISATVVGATGTFRVNVCGTEE